MAKSKLKFISKVLMAILAVAALVALLMLLRSWTRAIEERSKRAELVSAMKDVIRSDGELGLFGLAGIPVDNVCKGAGGYYVADGDGLDFQYSGVELQNMNVYSKCAGSVVHVSVYEESQDQLSQGKLASSGSGLVYSRDGYIITCHHVVEGGTVIKVSFADGSTVPARIVGFDKENDIAVLKCDKELDFDPIAFDASGQLAVGQRVFALGNPLGFDRTLSSGYITGLSRPLRNSSGQVIMGMIQTDVAASSGNSGCPLLDTRGNVIGIMFSAYTSAGNYQAMSFAIPSSTVLGIVDELISTGRISRGWLDIVSIPLTDALVSYMGLDISHGLLVSQVAPNGNAAKAGLKAGLQQVKYGNTVIFLGGDVITMIDDVPIFDASDVYTALMNKAAGAKVNLTVHRNGQDFKLSVQLVERTDDNLGWLLR